MVVIIIVPARGIAALSSARLPVLVSRLSMGSQKCMGAACASTHKGDITKKSPVPWQMGYNFFGTRHCERSEAIHMTRGWIASSLFSSR
jgi:hypothetical protein